MHSKNTWALPYIAGRLYHVWWHTGLDFTQLTTYHSNMLTENDPGIMFKFNYTLHRQAFDVGANKPSAPLNWANLFYPTGQPLDETNCTNG